MDPLHRQSDLQSLRLNQAAVAALRDRPHLLERVLGTLDHWDRVAPEGSQALRDEWRRILLSGNYEQVLTDDDRGQQLRQASPLGRALDPVTRLTIIRECKGRNSNT